MMQSMGGAVEKKGLCSGDESMAWAAYNVITEREGLIVLDSRPLAAFSRSHIRGSACVTIRGQTLERIAGPPLCWWDRHVLLVSGTGTSSGTGRKRKAPELEADKSHSIWEDPVARFLEEEGLLKSLHILSQDNKDDSEETGFLSFAKSYPFLVTKSNKASSIRSYPSEIVPGLLYLGDLEHAKADAVLLDLKITHVLTVHTEPLKLRSSFVHLFCDLDDVFDSDIMQYFEPAYEFIENAKNTGKRVLVHCGAGVSRSAAICASYLIRSRQWGVEETLKFLKDRRSKVDPNPGFVFALQTYHDMLKAVPLSGQLPFDDNADPSKLKAGSKTNSPVSNSHLDVVKDGKIIERIALSKSNVLFGRAKECDVVLGHASISRQHARLKDLGNNELRLVDLGSAHGTYMNGELISSHTTKILKEGDKLRFGESTRTFIVRGEDT